jgi:hypothetical protein
MLPNWQSSALFLFHEKIGSRPSQRAGVCNRRTGSPELSSLKSHLAPAGPEASSTRLETPLPALALAEPPTSPLLFDPASNCKLKNVFHRQQKREGHMQLRLFLWNNDLGASFWWQWNSFIQISRQWRSRAIGSRLDFSSSLMERVYFS